MRFLQLPRWLPSPDIHFLLFSFRSASVTFIHWYMTAPLMCDSAITDCSLKCPALVFLSSTLYILCIKTKRKFVNHSKGKITPKVSPWGRRNLAMNWRSGSFQLKKGAIKKVKIHWELKSINFVMFTAIPWEVIMLSINMWGWVTPLISWKVGVVVLGIIFLNTELNKPQSLRDEMIFMNCLLQIKRNIYSIGIFHASLLTHVKKNRNM